MTAKPKAPKDWKCQECGKRLTLKAAEKAAFGADGCPKCGGSDIDLADDATNDDDTERGLRAQMAAAEGY